MDVVTLINRRPVLRLRQLDLNSLVDQHFGSCHPFQHEFEVVGEVEPIVLARSEVVDELHVFLHIRVIHYFDDQKLVLGLAYGKCDGFGFSWDQNLFLIVISFISGFFVILLLFIISVFVPRVIIIDVDRCLLYSDLIEYFFNKRLFFTKQNFVVPVSMVSGVLVVPCEDFILAEVLLVSGIKGVFQIYILHQFARQHAPCHQLVVLV